MTLVDHGGFLLLPPLGTVLVIIVRAKLGQRHRPMPPHQYEYDPRD
jgi:hypothetical protein